MKSAQSDQVRKNNEWLSANEIVNNPDLKKKYFNTSPFKFGGRKRTTSNNGQVGRAARRKKRNYLGGGPGLTGKN
jgi:hypothetical protein